MAYVSARLSSYPAERSTDGSAGSAQGASSWIEPLSCSGVVNGQGAESFQKIIHRLLGDHFSHEDRLFTLIWLSWVCRMIGPMSFHPG